VSLTGSDGKGLFCPMIRPSWGPGHSTLHWPAVIFFFISKNRDIRLSSPHHLVTMFIDGFPVPLLGWYCCHWWKICLFRLTGAKTDAKTIDRYLREHNGTVHPIFPELYPGRFLILQPVFIPHPVESCMVDAAELMARGGTGRNQLENKKYWSANRALR